MFLEELQEIFMEPIGELGVAVGDVAAKAAELSKALKSDRSKPRELTSAPPMQRVHLLP